MQRDPRAAASQRLSTSDLLCGSPPLAVNLTFRNTVTLRRDPHAHGKRASPPRTRGCWLTAERRRLPATDMRMMYVILIAIREDDPIGERPLSIAKF
jgi:hypothetical protein